MIDRASIMAWNEFVPWTDFAMVEQDLIISRALVDIFSDDFLREQLAFRGGTALHKLYLSPQIRYSEDIDLVIMCIMMQNNTPCLIRAYPYRIEPGIFTTA